jgi:hypothetical protein
MVPLIGSVRLRPQPVATVGAFPFHLRKTINELDQEHIPHIGAAVEASDNGSSRVGAPRDTDSTKLTVSQVSKKRKRNEKKRQRKMKKKEKALYFSLRLQRKKAVKLRT